MTALTPDPSPADAPHPPTPPRERGENVSRRRKLGAKPSGAIVEAARHLRKEATRSEELLWRAIRGRQLGHKFRRQHPIGRFVLDFYCAEQRLAIEVDGAVYEELSEHDAERDALLNARGIRVVRIPASLVETHVEAAVNSIKEAFRRHPSLAVVWGEVWRSGRGAGGEGRREHQ